MNATNHDHPSLEEVRRHWGLAVDIHRRDERLAAFDRLIQALQAEAWEDGAQAAWGTSGEGWNGEYAERPGPPGVFRAQNPTFPNPHLEDDA